MTAEGAPAPAVGDLVYDEARERLGRVTAIEERRLFLRPTGGGEEWAAQRDQVREPKASERLGPRIAAMNRANGWGRRG